MNMEKLLEKIAEFISDPRGREMLKTLVYLAVPIIVLWILKGLKGQKPTPEKASSSAPVEPSMRGSSPVGGMLTPETVKQTQAREEKKAERDLQEVLGRGRKWLENWESTVGGSPARRSFPPEKRESSTDDQDVSRDELLKIFSRRR